MIYCNALGLINALGDNLDSIAKQLAFNQSGLVEDDSWLINQQKTFLGKIKADLPIIPEQYPQHNSRNNRLLLAALEQIRPQVDNCIATFGKNRIAIIIGTSTSGIDEGEKALAHVKTHACFPNHFYYQQQQFGDPSLFLSKYLDLSGPAYAISTACSSSARAIISGASLIDAGVVDAAIVGGADSLCKMAINGFNALEAISSQICMPFSEHRNGINIGEAAGLMLLTRNPAETILMGYGASSDAWHMSAPHPEGNGAEEAMKKALYTANLHPEQIGYINLHGTATQLNDQAESQAVHRLFGSKTPCSSTKHLTGHTLAAAGITEAGLSILLLQKNIPLPKQLFTDQNKRDNKLADIQIVTQTTRLSNPLILSNSFAFGGNNACLIFGKKS